MCLKFNHFLFWSARYCSKGAGFLVNLICNLSFLFSASDIEGGHGPLAGGCILERGPGSIGAGLQQTVAQEWKGSPPPASPRQPCSTRPCPAEANPSPGVGGGLACSGASGGRLTKRGTLTTLRPTTAIPRRVRVGRWRWRELSTRGPRLQSPNWPAAAPWPL
jgi:hypothetical protein